MSGAREQAAKGAANEEFGGAFGGAPHGRCGPTDYRTHIKTAADPMQPEAGPSEEKEGEEWFDAPEADAESEVEEEAPRDPEEDARLLASAKEAKERGNAHFVKAEYDDAVGHYTQAIELAPPKAPERAVFYANRAACYSKVGEHAEVVQDCNAALALQPDYVKALVRRAQARESLEEFHEALEDMKRVAELDPSVKVRRPRLSQPALSPGHSLRACCRRRRARSPGSRSSPRRRWRDKRRR